MYRNTWNMDPRGRKNARRGFRPEMLLGLIGLMCFGWVILAVVFGLLGAGVMVFGSVISGIVSVLPRVLSRIITSRSVIAGLILGLVWYFRTHRKNTETKEEAKSSGTVDGAKVETEIVEAPAYRTFNA